MEIAILGGGVAGVSTAIALKQQGFEVRVYERHTAASDIGAGIVVWPNAAFVLERLGILNEIERLSGHPTQMQRFSQAGDDLGTMDIEVINQQMGYPSLSILRRDLQAILIAKLESLGVSIIYGHQVTGIDTTPMKTAEVRFQTGLRISADVIVGADGRMASHARRYVLGDNAPVYQGFINWVGVFESDEDTFPEVAIADYWGTGDRFGVVPVNRRKAYWAGATACPDRGARDSPNDKAELNRLFADWPEPVHKIIEQTPAERINKIYVHDHNPTRTWHKHNLILIGDAAHAPLPTSGQGACQALEDAWHFARCLVEHDDALPLSFEAFTNLRFEKTANIIMAGREVAAALFNRDEAFCKARNARSKKTDFHAAAAGMSRLWGLGLH